VGGGETASSDESTRIYALYRARVQEAAQRPPLPTRAIHIELPRAVRMEGDGYAQVLAEFLTRAAPLLLQP
jgi:hypothetical protein